MAGHRIERVRPKGGRPYSQHISNIATKLIYATAPIAYLHSVQLNRRSQWSVRIVFLMSLVEVAYFTSKIPSINLPAFWRIHEKDEVYYALHMLWDDYFSSRLSELRQLVRA
jgi:hypothetical protein